MTRTLLVKSEPNVYFKNDAKEYEDAYIKEKEIQKKNTTIYIQAESDKPILLSYKCKDAAPYTNIVKKLILTANYDIDKSMFVNSPVTYSTIKVYKQCLHKLLKGELLHSYRQSCSKFIKEVKQLQKQGYKPIDSLSDTDKDIKQVIDMKLIPVEVGAYLYEPLTSDTNKFTIQRNKQCRRCDVTSYNIIIDNYKSPVKKILSLLDNKFTEKTVMNYIGYIRLYERSGKQHANCPDKFFELVKEKLTKQSAPTEHNTEPQKITYVKGEIVYAVIIDDKIYSTVESLDVAKQLCKIISEKSPNWNVKLSKLIPQPF